MAGELPTNPALRKADVTTNQILAGVGLILALAVGSPLGLVAVLVLAARPLTAFGRPHL